MSSINASGWKPTSPAGGGNAALKRRRPPYVRVSALSDISAAITEWRMRNANVATG